ncbi:MAG: GNAT family N-acetyltransferase, partial [Actinomycetes bacterium]
MARAKISVREAASEDTETLVALWGGLGELPARPRWRRRAEATSRSSAAEGLRRRLDSISADPKSRVVVALDGATLVGFAVMSHQSVAAFLDTEAVHVHVLNVDPEYRRRGVGRTLLASAATYAEQTGAEHVIASVDPTAREANRFFARLGFSPFV